MTLNNRETLISDLVHYTGLPREEVVARMADTQAVPNQWKREYGHKEGEPEDYHRFYTFNWLYLFDLANFASQYRPELANTHKYMKGRCLDFGCGIGTVAVDLCHRPEVTQVDAIDICIITSDFLRFRKRKHKAALRKLVIERPEFPHGPRSTEKWLDSSEEWSGPLYDFIYARDVLEHCWNRVELVKLLCNNVSQGGVIVEATPIEKIGAQDGWENVRLKPGYDLWDVLRERGFEKIESEWTGGFSLGYTNVWRKK